MSDRLELAPELREALLDLAAMPDEIEIRGSTYRLNKPLGHGYKAVVWSAYDDIGVPRAIKLADARDYAARSFIAELKRAGKLSGRGPFADLYNAAPVDVQPAGHPPVPMIGFVQERVNGTPLNRLVVEQPDQVTGTFIVGYVKGITGALALLERAQLRHDDLHAGNIMLERPAGGPFGDAWTVRVVDLGSIKDANAPLTKITDDHGRFVEHLVILHNALRRRRLLSVRDRRFLNQLEAICRRMLEPDPVVALRNPESVLDEVERAYRQAAAPPRRRARGLRDPFEFISAEQMADDRLLVSIFAQSCPWLHQVNGPDGNIVVGPRGCGKSTIFRWLNLRAHLHKDGVKHFDDLRVWGFYVSCSADLQNRLGWVTTRASAEKFSRELIHYFALLLLREVCDTLAAITEREDAEAFWGLGPAEQRELYEFVLFRLPEQRIRPSGASRMRQLVEVAESQLFHTHTRMLAGLNLTETLPASFLGDLTQRLVAVLPIFSEKKIAFLVDDYSSHRVPEAVQVVLNRVVWERRASHVFKLSSEMYGLWLNDSFNATADPSREFIEVDCGEQFIALDDHDQQDRVHGFARELLAKRLSAAGYMGDPETLLGYSSWPEGSLGRALAAPSKGRYPEHYHGLECIANLCSGDVATLLAIFKRIFLRADVTEDTTQMVAKSTQHAAIAAVSREQFEQLRHHYPHGPRMYALVLEFGNLVGKLLKNARTRAGSSDRPLQCSRIEVDEDHTIGAELLPPELLAFQRELVRRSVFIELGKGRSRRNVPTTKWQLRRALLPTFNGALSKTEAIKWDTSEFKYFLTDPAAACAAVLKQRLHDDDDGQTTMITL